METRYYVGRDLPEAVDPRYSRTHSFENVADAEECRLSFEAHLIKIGAQDTGSPRIFRIDEVPTTPGPSGPGAGREG